VGLHNRYAQLLNSPQYAEFAKQAKDIPPKQAEKLKKKFKGMMHALYNQKGAAFSVSIIADEQVQDFINTHADILDSSFTNVKMSDAMRDRLNRSDYIFSGIKAFHELNQAFPSLTDDNGDVKPFEQFLNDVQTVNKDYNTNYLRSEYNFVNASADMAAKWEQFAEDGDRYLLQYRTAGDDHVREEHAALEGVTLPVDDSFWETYYPPNGWNCRCTVVQVRKDKYPETTHADAMNRGEAALQNDKHGFFRFNPGIQQRTMPAYNPYTISKCNSCPVANGNDSKLAKAIIPTNQLCSACQLVCKNVAQRYTTKTWQQKIALPVEEAQEAVRASLNSRNIFNKTITHSHLEKRHFAITKEGFDRAMFHATTSEAKWVLESLPANLRKLTNKTTSQLGGNKDLLDPQKIRNNERKRQRGVKYYNTYEYEINGETWLIGMEVINYNQKWHEEPYFITKKKGK
jgi:SPP1 gp7 family putative phage head morphogenesis protein